MKLCVVINSCFEYRDKALPPLLESLDKANVPKECIHVVLGQCASDEDIEINGIKYHNRRWYNIDNNAMLWLTQERALDAEWVVYLHDTSTVADYFWQTSLNVIHSCSHCDCIKLYPYFSMGMGFYKTSYLYRDDVRDYMKLLENYDKERLIEIKNQLQVLEDTLFKYAHYRNNNISCLPNEYKVVQRDVKMYGSDVPRIVEFYEVPGIYKIKANHLKDVKLFIGL